MRKTIAACLLTALVFCAAGAYALAADPGADIHMPKEEPVMPESGLYCGQIEAVTRDEAGNPSQLLLTSQAGGDYAMNLSAATIWVDGGRRERADSRDLTLGETVYVFHSLAATRSLPPQSATYVVVRNVPQDAGCPLYHTIEAVDPLADGGVRLTTDRGGLLLTVEEGTELSAYQEGRTVSAETLQVGQRVLAWYGAVMLSYPGQARVDALMALDGTAPAAQSADQG